MNQPTESDAAAGEAMCQERRGTGRFPGGAGRLRFWIAVSAAILVFAVHNTLLHPWTLDDAFIFFRYVDNLVAGHGLVYNPGELVEGYTSFLWVILLSAGRVLGVELVLLSKLLGTALGLGSILLVAFTYRLVAEVERDVAAVAALLLGTCGIFTAWAASGMEVTLFGFLFLLTVLLYLRVRGDDSAGRTAVVGVLSALLVMARPEGLLVFGILVLDLLGKSLRQRSRRVAILAAAFLAAIVPYLVWKQLYYGSILPNTFHQKVGANLHQVLRGLRYARQFAVPALLLLSHALVGTLSLRWFQRYPRLYLLPVIVLVYFVYVILVGGDCMPAFRFFAPVMPLLCLVSASAVAALFCRRTDRRTEASCPTPGSIGLKPQTPALIAIALISLFGVSQMRYDRYIHDLVKRDQVARDGREVGLWLRDSVPRDAVIATNTGGSIPYYSGLRTIDMLGANDRHIAQRDVPWLGKGWAGHEKCDGRYVLARAPDYIQFGSSLGSERPLLPSDYELHQDPLFHERYELERHRLASGREFLIYRRRVRLPWAPGE